MTRKGVLARVMREVHEVIPPTIFFLVAFHLIAVSRALMLRQYGIRISAFAGATVGALLVAKVVLIADKLPFVNRFPDKPLMYNVGWKTTIYAVAALLVHYLEHLVPVWWTIGDLARANRHLLDHVVWSSFWVIQLWLIVLLFVYCAFREFVRAVGPARVRAMFFGGEPAHQPSPRSAS